jgi:alanine racemase
MNRYADIVFQKLLLNKRKARKVEMTIYTLAHIAKIVSGTLSGEGNLAVQRFSIDSRTLSNSTNTAFIALRGDRHDGHIFIPELVNAGVKVFITDNKFTPPKTEKTVNWIFVKDTLVALQSLAAWHRIHSKASRIGITGSNGKTIVKEWIYQSLHDKVQVFRSPRSYNSQVGVPLSVLMIREHDQIAVLEAGISKKGEMLKLEKIISPETGIITNIGEAHQENFISPEEKLLEKLQLFTHCTTIIYCMDHTEIHRLLRQKFPEKKFLCWGKNPEADFRVVSVTNQAEGITFTLRGKTENNFTIPFHDLASFENAMHVAVLLYHLGYSDEFVRNALSELEPVEMRLEILKGIQSSTLISDTYNSDLASLSNALDLLLQQKQHKHRTLVLSDILQSGRSDEDLYTEVASMLVEKDVSRLIGIGPSLMKMRDIFPSSSLFFHDTAAFLRSSALLSFRDEAILVKGARKFGFERISRELQFRTHQTLMEINMNAMVQNLNFYRSLLSPGTRIMAMVKAFSYGSGSFEIANLLQFHKVNYLAVAYIDEGIDLRSNGITLPIMVMNPESGNFKSLVEYGLQPEIYSFEGLKEFRIFLNKNDISDYPIHIKLDTGMHRLGFFESELEELAKELRSGQFSVVSVFSHLVGSDEQEHDDFTREQIALFRKMSGKLKQMISGNFMMHILNSAGIERFVDDQMDMVRLGIGLYGVSGNFPGSLLEVSTFKTSISQVRELESGTTVGYSRKGILGTKRTIATLPVGYADGLPRSLGNGKGSFLVSGKLSPTVGNICMDMCMIDITGTNAKTGDEVIIFGKEYPVVNIATAAGTIPYEILTGISERVKRIYYQE